MAQQSYKPRIEITSDIPLDGERVFANAGRTDLARVPLKSGCGCGGTEKSELEKAISERPILAILAAFALGWLLKGRK